MSTYNAAAAIVAALKAGRRLSQLDCHEFQVEDMRTPISHLSKRWEETHDLKTRWITTPVKKVRIKEYWLEKKEGAVC